MVSKKTIIRISLLSIVIKIKRPDFINEYKDIKIYSLQKIDIWTEFITTFLSYIKNIFYNYINLSPIKINLLASSIILLFLLIYILQSKHNKTINHS